MCAFSVGRSRRKEEEKEADHDEEQRKLLGASSWGSMGRTLTQRPCVSVYFGSALMGKRG